MRIVLVTGAAGFIGSFLVKKLLETTEDHIVGLDNVNSYYDPGIKEARLRMLAKADADIARLYDERLVQPDLLPLGAHLRDLLSQACAVVLGLTGQAQLMAHSPETLEFIRLRNTYLDPLHLLQAELLARSRRQQAAQDSPLEQALLVTVAGIAAGLRNTG